VGDAFSHSLLSGLSSRKARENEGGRGSEKKLKREGESERERERFRESSGEKGV
jgi:hypothetical protein